MFIYLRSLGIILVSLILLAGCSTNQTVKNAWKATRSSWYSYVNKPAVVDYEETGEIDAYEASLATRMIGIDVQWQSLERAMSNADKPPTSEWVQAFFARFPWLTGFAGVNAEGKIVGQAGPELGLDFAPLLEVDKKQNVHALRGVVQETSSGPIISLATPLYKDTDFLGVVVAYFDMRALMRYCTNPEELIVLSPQAVLWPGKFNVESTPLTQVKWEEVLARSSHGTVSDSSGSFYWINRYLGNQPIIFAVPITKQQPEKEERIAAVAASMGQGGKDITSSMPPSFMPGPGTELSTSSAPAFASGLAPAQPAGPSAPEAITPEQIEQPRPTPRRQTTSSRRAEPALSPIMSAPEIQSPIHPAPDRPSPIHPAPDRPSPIHPSPDRSSSANENGTGREIDPAPKTNADIDAGSSSSVLRPPSPIHPSPKKSGKVPEVNIPE